MSRSPPIYGGDGPAITLGTKDAYVVSRMKLARTLFALGFLMSSGCGNDRSGSGGSGGGSGAGGTGGTGGTGGAGCVSGDGGFPWFECGHYAGQPCCEGGSCTLGPSLYCEHAGSEHGCYGTCRACGQVDQPCCPAGIQNPCAAGLACRPVDAGMVCQSPCSTCASGQVCVQRFDGQCRSGGVECVTTSGSCGNGTCTSACQAALCPPPYQCMNRPPCGTEISGAFTCYGP
ncbi:MAG TPA: hypothetical protein VKN99_07580 [Polyangia bacterium]|nr:hypothetical protein [Polyangia bacterium]